MQSYSYEKFFDLSMEIFCVTGTDGFIKRINPAFQQALGWTSAELMNQLFMEFVHPEEVEATQKELQKLLASSPSKTFQNRFRCSDGSYKHLLWNASLDIETGLIFAVARDMTLLSNADQRYRLAIDSSPVAMVMVDQQGSIQFVNKETERLFGYSRDQIIGRAIEVLIPAQSHFVHENKRAEYIQNPVPKQMGMGRQLTAVRRDGSIFPVEVGLNPIQLSDGIFVISSIIDLTMQKQVEQRMLLLASELEEANAHLAHLAITDKLTGLQNRRAFDEQLGMQIQLLNRMAGSLSLLLIDIDYFKQYNDQFGHLAGDEAMRTMASILKQNLRKTDFAARYGGEEFAIILPATGEQGAIHLSEEIRSKVQAHPWKYMELTISVGASTISFKEGTSADQKHFHTRLISEADQSLYYSKDNGRNRVTHYAEILSEGRGAPLPDFDPGRPGNLI